jgi:hypothetical protein
MQQRISQFAIMRCRQSIHEPFRKRLNWFVIRRNVRIVRSLTNTSYQSTATTVLSHCADGFAAHSSLHRRERTLTDEHGRLYYIKIKEKFGFSLSIICKISIRSTPFGKFQWCSSYRGFTVYRFDICFVFLILVLL